MYGRKKNVKRENRQTEETKQKNFKSVAEKYANEDLIKEKKMQNI